MDTKSPLRRTSSTASVIVEVRSGSTLTSTQVVPLRCFQGNFWMIRCISSCVKARIVSV
jgi:hypothetical protein